jgi:hypothetical protein
MCDNPKIDTESWWRDPMAEALKAHFEFHHGHAPNEPYGGESDGDVIALMQLELLLQAKLIRRLMREGYEFNPMVLAVANVVGAAEAYIKDQAISALSR